MDSTLKETLRTLVANIKALFPTKTSDLTNDGEGGSPADPFVKQSELPTKTSDLTNDGEGFYREPFITKSEVKQSNWSQMDASKYDYINGRTHFDTNEKILFDGYFETFEEDANNVIITLPGININIGETGSKLCINNGEAFVQVGGGGGQYGRSAAYGFQSTTVVTVSNTYDPTQERYSRISIRKGFDVDLTTPMYVKIFKPVENGYIKQLDKKFVPFVDNILMPTDGSLIAMPVFQVLDLRKEGNRITIKIPDGYVALVMNGGESCGYLKVHTYINGYNSFWTSPGGSNYPFTLTTHTTGWAVGSQTYSEYIPGTPPQTIYHQYLRHWYRDSISNLSLGFNNSGGSIPFYTADCYCGINEFVIEVSHTEYTQQWEEQNYNLVDCAAIIWGYIFLYKRQHPMKYEVDATGQVLNANVTTGQSIGLSDLMTRWEVGDKYDIVLTKDGESPVTYENCECTQAAAYGDKQIIVGNSGLTIKGYRYASYLTTADFVAGPYTIYIYKHED